MATRIRAKLSSEPRDEVLQVRLSKSEKEQLKNLAAKAGISIAAFMLGKSLGESFADVIMGKSNEKK